MEPVKSLMPNHTLQRPEDSLTGGHNYWCWLLTTQRDEKDLVSPCGPGMHGLKARKWAGGTPNTKTTENVLLKVRNTTF